MRLNLILATALIGATAHADQSLWDPATIQSQQTAAQRALAASPLNVLPDSHLIVMEYEAWFGPNGVQFEGAPATPLLSSASMAAVGRIGYDSADPAVIKQHVAWMTQMGVDAIALDESNGVSCTYATDINAFCAAGGPSFHDHLTTIMKNNVNIYDYYRDNNVPIKIIPLLGGQDQDVMAADAGGACNMEKQLRHFKALIDAHPNQAVYYQGKPLVLIYNGTPFNPGLQSQILQLIANTGLGNQLTVRFTTGYTDSQSNLYAVASGIAGMHQLSQNIWSWIDRFRNELGLLPSYSVSNGQVENFTVTSAFPGAHSGWDDGSGSSRSPAAFQTYMDIAKRLHPTFLLINQFNEYVQPDQGNRIANTNDLEPTVQWGTGPLESAAASIADYKAAVGGAVISTASLSTPTPPPSAVAPAAGFGAPASGFGFNGNFVLMGNPTVFHSNGTNHYCGFANPTDFFASGGIQMLIQRWGPAVPAGWNYDGTCKVR